MYDVQTSRFPCHNNVVHVHMYYIYIYSYIATISGDLICRKLIILASGIYMWQSRVQNDHYSVTYNIEKNAIKVQCWFFRLTQLGLLGIALTVLYTAIFNFNLLTYCKFLSAASLAAVDRART